MNKKSKKVQKKLPAKSPKNNYLITFLAIIACLYAGYNLISYVYSIYNLKTEFTSLNNKKDVLLYEEQNLKNEIVKLNDKDYIARYAKENYFYSKDGEYILKFDNEKLAVNDDKQELTVLTFYIIAGGTIFTIAILFVILTKKKTAKLIK